MIASGILLHLNIYDNVVSISDCIRPLLFRHIFMAACRIVGSASTLPLVGSYCKA
jgi:hypothetical protein